MSFRIPFLFNDDSIRYGVVEDSHDTLGTAWIIRYKVGPFGRWRVMFPYKNREIAETECRIMARNAHGFVSPTRSKQAPLSQLPGDFIRTARKWLGR